MMSRYRVTAQYRPYSGLSQKCTGSSRRSGAKKPCQMSSEYKYGLLTSISSSGTDQGSRYASALKSIPFHTGATTSFIGFSCRSSCAAMPTVIERDVRPMKIAFEFPTCQRRRGAAPKSANRVTIALEEGEDLAVHSAGSSNGGQCPQL